METFANSVDDVDRDDWSDGIRRVLSCGKNAGTNDDADLAIEVVFNGWGEGEGLGWPRVEKNRCAGIGDVISVHGSVVLMAKGGIGGEHPTAGDAVLSGQVDEQGGAWIRVAAKSLRCAVNADVLQTHLPGK